MYTLLLNIELLPKGAGDALSFGDEQVEHFSLCSQPEPRCGSQLPLPLTSLAWHLTSLACDIKGRDLQVVDDVTYAAKCSGFARVIMVECIGSRWAARLPHFMARPTNKSIWKPVKLSWYNTVQYNTLKKKFLFAKAVIKVCLSSVLSCRSFSSPVWTGASHVVVSYKHLGAVFSVVT